MKYKFYRNIRNSVVKNAPYTKKKEKNLLNSKIL